MEGWRAAAALLLLAATIGTIRSAPLNEQTALDVYDGESADGCYYNFQHYGEGDRIMTNEPCLNCTCHNRMLMCYLRVCPFTKPIGQDCSVEKRGDQCCPVITCPDVPVDLLTSTSTALPSDSTFTDVGHLDKFGCSIDGRFYAEGSKVPPAPNKPCELCYCIRNMTACVMQECTLHVDGCTPVYRRDVCCPVRYSCDHPDDDLLKLDDLTTTVRPTPGFMLTTTVPPGVTQDCIHDDNVYADGALIKTEKACEHCYCMKGDIVCVVQECGAPMENEGKNCTALAPREGQCCPDTYICEGDDETFTESTEMPEITTLPDVQNAVKDEVSQETVPVFDKYPDEESEIPDIQENVSQDEVTQSNIADNQDIQDKLQTAHIFTTEATISTEISTSAQYGETGNTVQHTISTDTEQVEIITESTSILAESTTVKNSQTTPLPKVDNEIDTQQKTEEISETQYTLNPENIDMATKTTKRYFDQFTGITTKSLPEFPTRSDVDLISENVYTTHIIPSHDGELATVTESNITPIGDSISTSLSENTSPTQDDSSESIQSLMTELPNIQTENTYESSSENDILTSVFTTKSPSETTPIALEPFEPTTYDEVIESETTQAPLVTEQAILEERIPALSTFTPEIFTSSEEATDDATAPQQNIANDVTTAKVEDTNQYELTPVPLFETTVSDTDKLEDHTVTKGYVAESTTEYATETPTYDNSDKQITVSNNNDQEVTTISAFDFTTLAPTATVDQSEKEEDDRVPILPQIPGEGDCLVDGITYINDSVIPNANKCVITCRCVSSIVHCDQVACNPPPAEMINCEPIDDGKDSCCPTYVCDQSKQTSKPESDNQMSELTPTYTPQTIDAITTTQVPVETSDSESNTSLMVSCDSGECQTKEELKPTVQPIEETGTLRPQSIEDTLCNTAECKFTKEPQKPIQEGENGHVESPVVSGCSGNECYAETTTQLGSGDSSISYVLSDIPTPPSNVIDDKPIDSSYDTKPCDSVDCTIQDKIVTSSTDSSDITESDRRTSAGTNDCESGKCENTTNTESAVAETTDETTPFNSIDKGESEVSTSDKCVGEDCQVMTTRPDVKPIACTTEDCKTGSGDLTPLELDAVRPTGEEVVPCDSKDCQSGTVVEPNSTFADCTSNDCQSGADEKTEQPSINELVCTFENCKYPETVPVSPIPVESSSTPEFSHNTINIDDIPIHVECTGENCSSQNITASSLPSLKPVDVECNGDNCMTAPTDQCSSPDCRTQDATVSSVTSDLDTKDVTSGSVTYSNSGTQDVTDSPVPTASYGIQNVEDNTTTYPDQGIQEVITNTVKPLDISSQDTTSSIPTSSNTDTQDIEGDNGTEAVTSPVTSSDLATEIIGDSAVTYPEENTQHVTKIPALSLDSGNEGTTGSPSTNSIRDTQDVTDSSNAAVNLTDVKCKDDDCVKVEKPAQCTSTDCLSEGVTTVPLQECNGDDCVKVPAPTCTTPECEFQAVTASTKPQDIPASLGCDGNDCGLENVTDGSVLEKKPAGAECNGDGCVKVPTHECSSPDCGLQAVTVSPTQNETPAGVECKGDDCVKAPQPQDGSNSLENHKTDSSECNGDDCVKVQTPECLSSECGFQDVPSKPLSEVKPEITECDGDHCVKIEIPKCSSPDCASQDAAVTDSQYNPTACQGTDCVNIPVPECTSADCAVIDVTKITLPTVPCDGEDCKVQLTTDSYPKINKEELPKMPTEAGTIVSATESSKTTTTPQNLVSNEIVNTTSKPEEEENTPTVIESYSTTPVVYEDEQSTPHNDIYNTIEYDDIPKIPEITTIDKDKTVQYVTEYTPDDKIGITTTPKNQEVFTTSEDVISAEQVNNKHDSDLNTTPKSYGEENQTEIPSSEQILGTIKPISQGKDQTSTEEVNQLTPTTDISISSDKSQTVIPALDEQLSEGSGVAQSSTKISDNNYNPIASTITAETTLPIENEEASSTTETIIKSPERGGDSSESTDSTISSTIKSQIDFEESQPQTTLDETKNSQTTETVFISSTTEEDLHKSQVSPVTPASIDSTSILDEDVETDLPLSEGTTSATLDISTKLSDKPIGTEDTNTDLPLSIVPDIIDKEHTDNAITATDRLESSTPEFDENATIKTETSTLSDKHTEEITNSNIDENQFTTYSPTKSELALESEATTAKLSETDDEKFDEISQTPSPETLTTTALPPVQSTETVNSETKIPDTTEAFGAITSFSTSEQEPDVSDTSTVMSGSVTSSAGLESDSLVTHAEESRPDIGLTTAVPDILGVATSQPTETESPIFIDEPISAENITDIELMIPAKVEVSNVNEYTTKPMYTTSINSETVATELVPPYKQENTNQETTSGVDSSTSYPEESIVYVTSTPVKTASSTEAPLSLNTQKSSVSENDETPIVDSLTKTETLSTASDAVTERYTTPRSDSEIKNPLENADKTEIPVVPEDSSISPPSEESKVTLTPEKVEDESTTSPSILVDGDQTTSQEILISLNPISETPKDESTTKSSIELDITPVSKDDNYQDISTPSENAVAYDDKVSTDSERLTTPISDDKFSSIEINSTPATNSHVNDITAEPAPTTFNTNFGDEDNKLENAGTTTPASQRYEHPSTSSDEQTDEDNKQQADEEITTLIPSEQNIQQDNRLKPIETEDVTIQIPIEEITEENLSTHGDSNDISLEPEMSTTSSHNLYVPGNTETTPNIINEEENIVFSEIPSSIKPADLEQDSESGAITSTLKPEVILEGSGQELESELPNPSFTKLPTSPPAFDSYTTETIPINVFVDDSALQSELELSTLLDASTTISAASPTEQIPVDISDSLGTTESSVSISESDFTHGEEKETATDSNTSAVTSGLDVNVETFKPEESDISTPKTHIQESEITTSAVISLENPSTPILDTFSDTVVTLDDITNPLISDTSTPKSVDITKSEVIVQPISTSVTEDTLSVVTKQTDHPEIFATETTTLSKIESPDNAGDRFGSDGNVVTPSSSDVPEISDAEQITTHPELSTVYNTEASPDDITITTISSLDSEITETITKNVTEQITVQPQTTVSKEIEFFPTTPSESEFVSLTTILGIPNTSSVLDNVTPSQITTTSEDVVNTGSSSEEPSASSSDEPSASSSEEPSASSEPDVEKITNEKTTVYPHSEVNDADLGLQPQTPSNEDISKPSELAPSEETHTTSQPEDEVQEIQKPIAPDTQSNLPSSGSASIPLPGEDSDHQLPESSYGQAPEEYDHEEDDSSFGPGTCRYGGKVYVSAQQIPRDDPCDFCFCFRSDIICLQQSCPPPIHGCHEEPIQGFCCPRYECPVSMATTLNVTSTTTTTTTTLPPHFLPHAYKGAAQRRGCQIKGHSYQVGENVRASSGPCLHCTCGGDGQMKCDPKVCTPEPMLRQMIAAAVSTKRRR